MCAYIYIQQHKYFYIRISRGFILITLNFNIMILRNYSINSMFNSRKIFLIFIVVQLVVSICFSMPQSSIKKRRPTTIDTYLRQERAMAGQDSKNREALDTKIFRKKGIPLGNDQTHRSNKEWDYGDHDPLPENLLMHKGENITKTLIHKVKRTINNIAGKLAQLQHDTRMRASQPRITSEDFHKPDVVREEDSNLYMTYGDQS